MKTNGQSHPMSHRGKTPARATRAGFTLIELIIVMALLLIVVGISFPSLKNFFRGRTLDSEARRFLSLTRYAQARAASEGLPMVLWIDSKEGTYGLQAEAGFLDLDRKAVEYEVDEGLSIEVSAALPNASWSQNKRTAVRQSNLPAIRINAEGYLEDTSPETIQLRQEDFGEEQSLWISQAGNRLSYEISTGPPTAVRR